MPELAVILDMDGLMVDSEPLSRRAWDQVLHVYDQRLDDATYSGVIGHRTAESAAILIDAYDLPLSVENLVRMKTDALNKIRARGVPVMPGLYELHSRILENNLAWGVATSSPRTHAAEILDQLGLAGSCHTIVGGDEVAHGKPAPDIYRLAAQRLGLPAAKCLAVEDSGPGCRSALAAGLMVVAVPNGDTRSTDFSAVDYVFPSLHAVSDAFAQLLTELANR